MDISRVYWSSRFMKDAIASPVHVTVAAISNIARTLMALQMMTEMAMPELNFTAHDSDVFSLKVVDRVTEDFP